MFDALFQALFSYRLIVFQQGEFRFDLTGASLFAAVLVAVAIGMAVFTYRRVQVTLGRPRDRVILTAIRLAILGLLRLFGRDGAKAQGDSARLDRRLEVLNERLKRIELLRTLEPAVSASR